MKLIRNALALLLSCTVFAIAANAAPTSPFSDLGDGLYVLSVENSISSVNFTSMADLGITRGNLTELSLRGSSEGLQKRAEVTTCQSRSNNLPNSDIVAGYACLQQYHTLHTFMGFHKWVWCFSGGAVIYECNYQINVVVPGDVANYYYVTNANCGATGLGYTRCTNQCGFNDLAMGRDYKGKVFCAPGVTGL